MVGRVAHVEGQLLRFVPEEKDWVATVRDAPFGLDDSLYSEGKSRAELIMPTNTRIRIGGSTQLQLITLRADVTEVDVASGMARFYNRSTGGVIKVTSPFGYVAAPAGTVFDLYVGDQSLEVISLKGQVDFIPNRDQARYDVIAGAPSLVSDGQQVTSGQGTVDADWDDWNAERDRLWSKRAEVRGESVRYLPPNLQDDAYSLDEHGRWERVYYEGGYRHLWRPIAVTPGWAPFTVGRWSVYYGDNCWVPDEPFGYLTHHYGSWVFVDGCNCWYWAPPVVRVGVNLGPFLPIPFGWYPGRVGWIYSGLNVGWIPLAPFETYYGRRPWGPRTLVVNNINITNININRYQYINRAVIVNQKNLYRVNNYENVRIANINRNSIKNDYRAAPVIDSRVIPNYNNLSDRYNLTNVKVEHKPHDMVVDRIRRNEQLGKQAGDINANGIRRDVAAMQPGKPSPDARIGAPRISDKLVRENEANKPLTDLQLPQRDLKARAKPPSEIAAGQTLAPGGSPGMPADGALPGRPRQPGSPSDDAQRVRPPRPGGETQQRQPGQAGRVPDEERRLRPQKPGGEGQTLEPGQAKPSADDFRKSGPPAPRQHIRTPDGGMPAQTGDPNQRMRPARPGGDLPPNQPGLKKPSTDNVQRLTPPANGRELRSPGTEMQRQVPAAGGRDSRPPEGPKKATVLPQPPRSTGIEQAPPPPQPRNEQPRSHNRKQSGSGPQEPSGPSGTVLPPPQVDSGGRQGKQGHKTVPPGSPAP